MTRAVAALALLLAACTSDGEPGARPTSPGPTTPSASPTPATPFDAGAVRVNVQPFLRGLDSPVFLTHIRDGGGRLYVVEQPGRIRVFDAMGGGGGVMLDIRSRVLAGGERGLLGLAFHPAAATNDRLFVNYTRRPDGDTIISEFRMTSPTSADRGSEKVLMRIEQPFANHNGGWLGFGPDGFLYVATGDGGSGGDPQNNGQKLSTLLGKILRIDVDRGSPYGVPPDNPFASRSGARGEIWDYGLRNPWRASFDRATGDVFLGDVGQGSREEIDVHKAADRGLNFGWRIMEGSSCFRTSECNRNGLVLPVDQYPTSEGCAVTGGYVYRGTAHPTFVGGYFFGDYCNGRIHVLSAAEALGGSARHRTLVDTELAISSFGEDEAGELYVVDLNGTVQRLLAA
jgi:glucose/arabinose dehydrogenase